MIKHFISWIMNNPEAQNSIFRFTLCIALMQLISRDLSGDNMLVLSIFSCLNLILYIQFWIGLFNVFLEEL